MEEKTYSAMDDDLKSSPRAYVCPKCDGDKDISVYRDRFNDMALDPIDFEFTPCPMCKGTGFVIG